MSTNCCGLLDRRKGDIKETRSFSRMHFWVRLAVGCYDSLYGAYHSASC